MHIFQKEIAMKRVENSCLPLLFFEKNNHSKEEEG